ncbi:MAG: RecQ family ATP-dependent DNA helicase [Patescibacteria group bacterium]
MILELLKKHFGYESFRPFQEEIIEHCLLGKNALVLMPTGGGKSLCYQIPALAFSGLTVVVSPLVALMKDQVDALNANGIPAAFWNSTLSPSEMTQVEAKAAQGRIKLLYLAPERLTKPEVRHFLRTLSISLIAVDEAHCISEWGHDFRPDYRNMLLHQYFPGIPVMALTATANARVRDDIVSHLKLEEGRIFRSSFNRPNLTYRVLPKKRSFDRLLAELKRRPESSAIIYCFSRKSTEKIAADLRANGVKAAAYHAGLTSAERTRVQERFIRDQTPVITATIAFGMGIDKPDVRLIVHMDLPKSAEGYYQETGRAGRDGLPSDCLLFFSTGDRVKHEYFIRGMEDPEERQRTRRQLQEMMKYGELRTCRRAFLLNYFGEAWPEANCGACDICVPPAATESDAEAPTEFDRDLFEQLRALRRRLAEDARVPPYMIFGDKTLQEMARSFPQHTERLAQVFGVGKGKLAQFGEPFLQVIRSYASERGIGEQDVAQTVVRSRASTRRALTSTMLETVRLFDAKETPERIAEIRNIGVGTVIQHLEKALEQGRALDASHVTFSSEERLTRIAEAFRKTGNDFLAPVRAQLGDSYSYDELRFARLILKTAPRHGVAQEEVLV